MKSDAREGDSDVAVLEVALESGLSTEFSMSTPQR